MRSLPRLLGLVASLLVLSAAGLAGAGSAAAEEPAPAGPAFGAQFHGMWASYDDTSRARYLDQLAGAGATWVRLDVSWAMLQPTGRDSYDMKWGVPFVDRVIGMATARGLKPLVTLWMTPAWANNGAGSRTLPTDPQDYANAASWAAARWAGQVPAWEVWNEPNLNHFMTGADPVAYTQLLRAAYPAIKKGNPSASVVFGGPSYNDTPWLTKAYAAGAQGAFDIMATHPYQGIADEAPETPANGSKYRFTNLAAVHELMVANGDGAKPIWATEFGWSSHANTGTEANWTRGVTQAQQADYLVRSLKLVAQTMPYVTHLFWYTDRDRSDTNVHNGNFGLFTNDLTPKPALRAVATYLSGQPAAPVATAPVATAPVATAPTVTAPVATAPTAPTVTAPIAPAPKVASPLHRRALTDPTRKMVRKGVRTPIQRR